VQVAVWPCPSSTVTKVGVAEKGKVTWLQVNAVLKVTTRPADPQLSPFVLTIWDSMSVAVPAALTSIVGFLQVTVGVETSTTVTGMVQVAVFPCPSLAVTVIVVVPMFAQVKEEVNEVVGIPQLSDLEATTSDSVIVAVPAALRLTVREPLQVTLGGVLSAMVTGMLQVAVFPFPSLAVTVTGLTPMLMQEKEEVNEVVTVPQTSDLEVMRSDSVIVAVPPALRLVEKEPLQVTLGGVTSLMVTILVQLDDCPFPSFTVTGTETGEAAM
jgi:hypothetical protein